MTHVKHMGFPKSRPGRPRSLAYVYGSRRGVGGGVRFKDGVIHFGIRIVKDRGRHYANKRHMEYGIAFWWRRARKGDRGFPHTFTIKFVVA